MIFEWEYSQRRLIEHWSNQWGILDLPDGLQVEYSSRMSRNLGRCYPAQSLIRLNPVLGKDKNRNLLDETLCHEAAHVAVYCLHGTAVKPHGHEWRAMMQLAGYEPRVTIPFQEVHGLPPKSSRTRYRYAHKCTDCNAAFVAGRTDRRWRCASCRESGRAGLLIVSRRVVG